MKNIISRYIGIALRHKALIKNFSYLSLMQVFTMAVPLISYPYLIRTIGIEIYGLVVFAQAIAAYILILVGFGFNISAAKDISIHQGNKEKISEIISSVTAIKTILFFFGLILFSFIVLLINETYEYITLFYLSLWVCLDDILSPFWYFQGIEKMQYITYITLVNRVLFLSLIFIFISNQDDYLFIPLINGVGSVISGIISLYIIVKIHKIRFTKQSFCILKKYFVESLPIFVSNISIKLYVSTNKVILGSFLGMTEVAYYDLGEKITSILKIPQGIINQTVFPKINKDRDVNFIRKLFKLSVSINVLLIVIIILFSKSIAIVLGGQQMVHASNIIVILAISVPIIAMSNIFGIQLLIPFGYSKYFSKVIVTSGVIYLFQLMIISLFFEINIYNVSLITVSTEIFVTLYMFYFCKKFKLWL